MFPLEGNAAGKACIAAKEGGCTETIIPGKNGFLIAANKGELKKTVLAFDIKKAQRMKADCQKQARRFGKAVFEKAWKKFLKGNVSNVSEC